MRTTFGVKNFRVFGDKGVSLNLKPVTILTGENSSGKSSIVKAMLLLRDYFLAVMSEPTKNPAAIQLDFNSPQLKMSGFDSARNKFSEKNSEIIFSYEATSDFAPFPFVIEYAFVKDPDNSTKGELSRIDIAYKNTSVLSFKNDCGKLKVNEMNLNVLFEALCIYLKGTEVALSTVSYSSDNDTLSLGKIESAVSKNGIDITEWAKYDHDCFRANWNVRDTIRQNNLVLAIKKSEEFDVKFYFPVFEDLCHLDHNSAINAISKAELAYKEYFTPEQREQFEKCKSAIIADFSANEELSFIEYYRAAENAFLSAYTSDYTPQSILGMYNYIDALFGMDIFSEQQLIYRNWGKQLTKDSIFQQLCTFLHMWQCSYSDTTDEYIKREQFADGAGNASIISKHHLLMALVRYLPYFIKELICPTIFNQFVFVGSSFTPVQRWYSYEEKSNLTDLLKKYKKNARIIKLNQKPDKKSATFGDLWELVRLGDVDYKIGGFTNKWLKAFGIAQSLVIDEDEGGLGFKLYLDKGKGEVSALADEGHGLTQLVLILLQIEVEIMQDKIRLAGYYNADSVITQCSTIALEEPEVSMHPSWQSKLALVLEDACREGIHFIIETHSEYLIRKTQAIVANYKTKEQFERCPFVVYYVGENGNAYDLEYTETGRFTHSFGPGFFDEASRSSVEVLKRERRMKDEAQND